MQTRSSALLLFHHDASKEAERADAGALAGVLGRSMNS
jgi:hypothetical protein